MVKAHGKRKTFTSQNTYTGEIFAELTLDDEIIEQYCSFYFMIQHGDFCILVVNTLNLGTLKFGKRLKKFSNYGKEVRLYFDNSSEGYADLVIGAYGLRSIVRNAGCLNFIPYYLKQAAFLTFINPSKLGRISIY